MPSPWAARGAFCLDCRTAQEGAYRCVVDPSHHLVEAATPHSREEMLTTVWGPASRRQRFKEVAKASGGGVAGGTAAEGSCAGCELGEAAVDPQALLVIVVVALAIVVLYFLGKFLLRAWRRYQSRPIPRGARARGLASMQPSARGPVVVGTVADAGMALAPLSQRSCVAYAHVLRYKRFARKPLVTLRDSATLEFDVLLDDGGRVRIPAGAVAIGMEHTETIRPDEEAAADYFSQLDGRGSVAPTGADDPFPFTEVREAIVVPGMRIAVHGPLEPMPDPDAPAGSYRDAAASLLSPVETPRLEFVRS